MSWVSVNPWWYFNQGCHAAVTVGLINFELWRGRGRWRKHRAGSFGLRTFPFWALFQSSPCGFSLAPPCVAIGLQLVFLNHGAQSEQETQADTNETSNDALLAARSPSPAPHFLLMIHRCARTSSTFAICLLWPLFRRFCGWHVADFHGNHFALRQHWAWGCLYYESESTHTVC